MTHQDRNPNDDRGAAIDESCHTSRSRWQSALAVFTGILIPFIVGPVAEATVYYVDAKAGLHGVGTIAEPFRQITEAVQVVDEGDTILVREGVYTEQVIIGQDRITIAAWGVSLPEFRSTGPPSLIVQADDCRILRVHFTGAAGIRIGGAANRVRGCVFDHCARPILARGRAHCVLLNEIRDCLAADNRALCDISGPGSSVTWNRFVNNHGQAAAISVRGRGCAVRHNILSGDAGHALRYAVLSASGPEETQFDTCINQQITHNRFHGGVREAFIRIDGAQHAGSRVGRNTIIDVGRRATAIQVDGDGVAVDANLVDEKTEFASTVPDHPAFLWPLGTGAIDPTDAPVAGHGARPAWPGGDLEKRVRPEGPWNLALGRPYLFAQLPSHGDEDVRPLCLTDGYAPQKMWGDEDGTDFTGWHMNGMDNRLYLWLDLGEVSDISAVRINAPHQHVWRAGMPLQIDVSVSVDDMAFHYAGSILPDLPQPPGNYWSQADRMRARGRYVLLTVYTDWSYTGIGEIEVLGTVARDDRPPALSGPVEQTLAGILAPAGDRSRLKIDSVGEQYMGRYRVNKTDLVTVKRQAESLGVHDRVSGLIDAATEVVRQRSSPDARANPEVIEAIGRVSTGVLRAAYGEKELLISSSTPYEKFSGSHIPQRHEVGIEAVHVKACIDEREPAAFFVTNPTENDMELRIELTDLNAGGRLFAPDQIVLRSPVDFTIGDPERKVKGDYFHDKNNAVVLLDHGKGNRLAVKSLDTRQVWISFDTTDVPAGTYWGEIFLIAEEMTDSITLPLAITVHPIRIPEQLDLHAYMWSYWGAPRIVNFRPEAFRDAIRHKANTILDHSVPHPESLGEDGVDEQGHMLKPLNYDNLDWQLDTWNNSFRDKSNRVKFYIFWLAFGNEGYDELRMGIPVGSPRWNTLIAEWFNDIAAHLQERHGMTTDQFAFYVRDELEPRQVLAYYEPMADALRAADPQRYPHARKVKLFVNPMTGTVMSSSWQHFEQRYDKLGLLAPLSGDYPDRILESFHRSGNLVWSHSTAGKNAGYGAKLSGWRCMQKGFGGMGFFIYIYSSYPNSYDRVYTRKDKVPGAGDETIVPSRGWEAWRDGQEDWYLLSLLKQTAHAARESSPDDFARGLDVFHGAIRSVFAAPDDPRVSVTAREKVVAEILRLREAG